MRKQPRWSQLLACAVSIVLFLVTLSIPASAAIQGEYFAWTGVSPPSDPFNPGNRRGTRIDGTVSFDWGTGAPGIGSLGIDYFSVRWRGQVYIPTAGNWTFTTNTDDGARLYLNGELVINQWVDQGVTPVSATRSLGVGWHNIHMQYFENAGGAVAQLLYAGPGVGSQIIPAGALRAEYGKGLLADYYNGNYGGAQTLAVSRNDDVIDYDWGNGSPQPEVTTDNFSVRWRGKVQAPSSGAYTFYLTSDDGPAMWLLGTERFNNLGAGHAPTEYSTTATLTAGQKYFIEVRVNEFGGGAVCRLEWAGPGITRQVVPESWLHAILNEAPSDILLSNATVGSNYPANTTVGTLSTTDVDNSTGANPAQTHSYALVSGTGDTHNSLFNISGTSLRTVNANMTPGAYSVRIRTTDNGQTPNNLTFEKALTVTVLDTTPPIVTLVQVESVSTILVTFNEPMGASATTVGNYVVSGSGKGSLTNSPASVALESGNRYRLTWLSGKMFIGGDITITVSNAQDAAGNAVGTPNSATHIGGGIAILPDAPVFVNTITPTNDQTPTWNWEQGAFAGSGNFQYDLNSSGTWTPTIMLSYTPVSNLAAGTHRLELRERDSAGNWSAISFYDISIDITPPNAPVVSGITPTNNLRPTWTWSSGGGDGNGLYQHQLNGTGLWTQTSNLSFTPSVNLAVGSHILRVQERDAAGNWSVSGQHIITIETTRPNVISLSAMTAVSDPTDMTPIPMYVIFDEGVINFTASDLALVNASVDVFAAASASEYSFNLLPSGQGLFSVQIPADVATDAAGNGNNASTVFSRTFASARPTVTLASVLPNPTNTSPIPATATFSSAVTGFAVGDIQVVNGSVSEFSGSGASYSFSVTPSGQGAVTVQVSENAAQDGFGALSTASNVLLRDYDSIAPGVSLASGAPNPTNAAVPVTVAFDEGVYGFDAADINATNATVTNVSGVDGDAVYAFTLTPSVSQGEISASVGAGAAADAAGNLNTAASEMISRDYDGVAPTVAGVTVLNGLAVDVEFSEAMGASALEALNYVVSGPGRGTLSASPASVVQQDALIYRLTWNAPDEMLNGGALTVTVSNVADVVGNGIGTPNSGADTAIGEAPTAACQDRTVNLSAPTLAAADIDNGSSDNNGIVSWAIDGAASRTFGCADIGVVSAVLTVTDAAGNSDSCTASITVVDDVAPAIVIPVNNPLHLVSGLTFSLPNVTATDACEGPVTVTLVDDGGIALPPALLVGGEYTLVYEASDSAGNVAVEELEVIVQDSQPIFIVAEGDLNYVRPVGGSVTFSVSASGGSSTLNYQWMRVTSDKALSTIPGAIYPSYSIQPVALSDAGQYLCEVYDLATTEQSDVFTLEVTEVVVPAPGLLGLALAAAATALVGAAALRKRR